MRLAEPPIDQVHGTLFFTDGSLAWAGPYLHEHDHPDHTHSFVEIAVVVGGSGVHRTSAGPSALAVGDVMLLRPGAWHGYEDCSRLVVYNCCFSVDLLRQELGWTRDDPMLGYLLWTGPYARNRRGILTTQLDDEALAECLPHLNALSRLQDRAGHRADLIGRLILLLGALARAVAPELPQLAHPAVTRAMTLLEAAPAHHWTLTELAAELHVAPGYLVRLFKATTGLPPMAYLSQHRLERAAAVLVRTDEPITQIARAVGWPDQNHFARRFRAHYGLSASEYRSRFSLGLTRPGGPARG
jgi:AraC family transcriptional regulator, L-rhamnose operon transcriptional activator RhaR